MKYNASHIGPLLTSAGRFINGPDFLKAFLAIAAISIPVFVGIWLHMLDYFISMSVGVLVCFGSDVAGSRRKKTATVLVASALAITAYVIIFIVSPHLYLLIPVLSVLVFAVSFIAVYGFTASLISFSGLLAIVLGFSQQHGDMSIWVIAAFMASGSLFYLLLSHLLYPVVQRRQIEHLMATGLELTSTYIEIRAKLATRSSDDAALEQELGETHVSLNENHENLRQLLLHRRKTSGSSSFKRKQLLIFIDMIDMLELALSNPHNYQRIKEQDIDQQDRLKPFIALMFLISRRLYTISLAVRDDEKIIFAKAATKQLLEKCKKSIAEVGIKGAKNREVTLFLRHLLDYLKRQLQKVDAIELVYNNIDEQERRAKVTSNRDHKKFLTQPDYDLRILKEHFHPGSPIFRHSARITVAMVAGFLIGLIFSIQNAYWILLTIVVIMRPGYTLTKKRGKERLVGTLIGAGISVPIVLITQNVYFFAVLAMVCMLLAYSMVQKNYRVSSVFITLSIVFVYALIEPNAFYAIQFRVIDTIAGAVIATLANQFLWPAWEYYDINIPIINAIKANRNYLKRTNLIRSGQGSELTPYRLARKEVFLAVGNLTASFQRMSQEPKHTHQHLNVVYELTGLNQTFLSATAALANFMQRNISGILSDELDAAIRSIDSKLAYTQKILDEDFDPLQGDLLNTGKTDAVFQHFEDKLATMYEPEKLDNVNTEMIIGQLKWLSNLAQSMEKAAVKLRQFELPKSREEKEQQLITAGAATPVR